MLSALYIFLIECLWVFRHEVWVWAWVERDIVFS